MTKDTRWSPDSVSDIPLSGSVLGLQSLQNVRTGEKLLMGGADDGSVAVWSLMCVAFPALLFYHSILPFRTLKLLARWTVFTLPLALVIDVKEGRLRGCALCVSEDGTIAVIAIDGFQLWVSLIVTFSSVYDETISDCS